MSRISIKNINFSEKKVIIRLDLNLPLKDGQVHDVTRIVRIIPTLKTILETKPKYIVILSHLGRPKPKPQDQWDKNDSLEPIASALQELLRHSVIFSNKQIGSDLYQELNTLPNGSVIMAENVRFYSGEEENSNDFSQQLSQLGDMFINDAFSCCHRAHASVVGITKYLPSYAVLFLFFQ